MRAAAVWQYWRVSTTTDKIILRVSALKVRRVGKSIAVLSKDKKKVKVRSQMFTFGVLHIQQAGHNLFSLHYSHLKPPARFCCAVCCGSVAVQIYLYMTACVFKCPNAVEIIELFPGNSDQCIVSRFVQGLTIFWRHQFHLTQVCWSRETSKTCRTAVLEDRLWTSLD